MTALKAPCPHGRYDEHVISALNPSADCPGGSLLPPDSLVVVKEDGEWPRWALDVFHNWAITPGDHVELFDALAVREDR